MTARARGMRSTVGLKLAVGLTGALLSAFVLGHMLGNLQVFVGPEAFNAYAAMLQGMPGPLWGARLGLLAAWAIHIWGNLELLSRNKAARPVDYAAQKPLKSTLSSRTMLLSGLILLAFIVYHLAHFTLGWVHGEHRGLTDELGRHDAYSMLVLSFQQPLIAVAYLIAMGLLFMHLAHGAASIFQTAGVRRLDWSKAISGFGHLFGAFVALGNIAIVLACLTGLVEPAQGVL